VSSLDDTRVLAGLCGARVIVPLGVGAQAPTPSGLFQFVWRAEAARPSGHEPIPLATLEPGRSYVLPPASR
jgi:hypothetical protein